MVKLKSYVEVCRELTAAQFCERHEAPFLLLSIITGGPMTPVAGSRAPTVDRLVIGDAAIPEGGFTGPEDWYMVAELRPRDETADRISIGCSERCDVVIDDTSVSRLHAWVGRAPHGDYIEDADSSLGTAVNSTPLAASDSVRLQSGDRVSLGTVELTYMPPAEFHTFVLRLAK